MQKRRKRKNPKTRITGKKRKIPEKRMILKRRTIPGIASPGFDLMF